MKRQRMVLSFALGVLFSSFAMGGEGIPPYWGAVTFLPQPHPWTCEIFADFEDLLKRLGVKDALDPASIRATLPDGKILPTRFVPEKEDAQRGLVRWKVPAMPKEEKPVDFRIRFSSRAERKWEPFGAEIVGEANLLPDGGLEELTEGAKLPPGVVASQNFEMIEDPKLAHSGRRCLKLLPLQNPTTQRWQNALRTPGGKGAMVEGKRTYRFSYWLRAQGCAGQLVSAAQVYWYRADSSYIKHDGFGRFAKADSDWEQLSATLESPPEARFTVLYVYNYSSTGALFLDDFLILPAQRVQLTSAQSESGKVRVSSRVDDPRLRRFDFGADDSAIWPGFANVTPKTNFTKELGYGWTKGQPYGYANPLPDDLARDYVCSHHSCVFTVQMPDGDYHAWLLIGDSGVGQTIIPTHVDWAVSVGNKELLRYKPDVKEWYEKVVLRNADDWWTPEVDIYERFIAPRFEEKILSVSARQGRIAFELSRVPLCAMVIYPAELAQAMTDELAQLRMARRQSVPVRYEPPKKETPAEISAHDQERGYAIFSRDLAEKVSPLSAPQPGEIVQELTGFAAPGEYEPFNFALYPLKELGEVSVTVSDLVGPDGARIPSSAIRVGVFRYVEIPESTKEYRYTVGVGPIQPRNPMPMPPAVTMRWLLDLRVPDDAKAGVYRGKITISPTNAPQAQLLLSLRVIPVKLGPTPIVAGLYHFNGNYWYIYWWRKAFAGRDEWLREQSFQHEWDDMLLLKEYNINSLSMCDDIRAQARIVEDELVIDPDHRFIQWMDLYKKAGMGPMPWYGFSAMAGYLSDGLYGKKLPLFSPEWERAYRKIIAWVKENQEKRGWPEVIFYLSDELSNEGATGAEKGRRLVELTKDIPGIRTVASMNGRWEAVMLPGLKIAMPNHAFPITAETIEEVRKAGCELWYYNLGNSRVVWGLYLWRTGATGRFQWYHRYARGAPYDPFDGFSTYDVTWITAQKPLPTPALVQIREGLDDLRYVTLLEKLIVEAKKSGKAAALEAARTAQKELDDLRELIPADARLLIGIIDPKAAGKEAAGQLAKSRVCDRYRWLIASHILHLQAILGK